MALPQNRNAVIGVLKEITHRILGQERPSWSCNCGCLSHGPAVAVSIDPAGDSYPGQEVLWHVWSVSMEPKDEACEGSGYSIGLSDFIPSEELEEIFLRHFGLNATERDDTYRPEVSGADRFYEDLPPAVRIKDNDVQTRFCFDWGRAQGFILQLSMITSGAPRRIPAGDQVFDRLVEHLKTLEPQVYRGGPDPELPFESNWLLDYQKALSLAEKADHIFFQNGGSRSDYRGTVQTGSHIVFMKVPV